MSRLCDRGLFTLIHYLWMVWLAAGTPALGAELTDSFQTNPLLDRWHIAGERSLFQWNAGQAALQVTWDSSKSNSFCYLRLGTILTKADSFQLSFVLRLVDLRIGSTPGKAAEFPIAIGLIQSRMMTNANAYRGAGVSSTYGVRNILEWDFFADGGFGDTWATTAVSSNNVFAYGHSFPVPLLAGDTYRITLAYSSSNQQVRTTASRNGQPMSDLETVSLSGLPDYRLDVFSITSYSDAVQTGLPVFHGSVLAHAFVEEIALTLPTPPVEALELRVTGGRGEASFLGRSNWTYQLERSLNLSAWQAASEFTLGTGERLVLRDTNDPVSAAFYRIRAERP